MKQQTLVRVFYPPSTVDWAQAVSLCVLHDSDFLISGLFA